MTSEERRAEVKAAVAKKTPEEKRASQDRLRREIRERFAKEVGRIVYGAVCEALERQQSERIAREANGESDSGAR